MKKSRIFLSIIMAALMLGILLPACTPAKAPAEQGANNSTPVMGDPVEAATTPPDPTSAPEETPKPVTTDAPSEQPAHLVWAISDGPSWGLEEFQFDINRTRYENVDSEKVGEKKTIEFAGKKYELEYAQMRAFAVGNKQYDEYHVVGKSNKYGNPARVCFLQDGTLYAVYIDSMLTVKTGNSASKEDVRDAVVEALKDELDVSGFEYCDISSNDDSYSIEWYNKKNGIKRDDGIYVEVDKGGHINRVVFDNRIDMRLDNLQDDICLEDYEREIETKLYFLYGSKTIVSYEIMKDNAKLTNIAGVPGIYVRVNISFKMSSDFTTGDVIDMAVVFAK